MTRQIINTGSPCIWHSNDICIFDVSQPGEQVVCFASACRDFEPQLTAADYHEAGADADMRG
jgi:hypothetical protein